MAKHMGPSEIEASMAPTQKVDAPELMASSVAVKRIPVEQTCMMRVIVRTLRRDRIGTCGMGKAGGRTACG
jgi:hypothetical protein